MQRTREELRPLGTTDSTKPGIYSEADGTQHQSQRGVTYLLSRIVAFGGVSPTEVTRFDVQRLVVANSDFMPPPSRSPAPLFAAPLAALGVFGL